MVKVLALREQFAHMDKVSGYDALYSYLPGDINTNSIFCNFNKIYPRGVGRLLSLASKAFSTSGFYNAQSLEVEGKMLFYSFTGTYNVIHYTYGEPYFSIGSLLKKFSKSAVVVTNHQPVSWWEKHPGLFKKYKNAAIVITLSEYDTEYFNTHQPGRAVCIPHGVDINFYEPPTLTGSKNNETFRVVFAGRYLRDMETLASVIKSFPGPEYNIWFDIVYLEERLVWQTYLKELMVQKNVTWHHGLSNNSLLNLYQQADCMLLPLNDCTANNAILEGLACGLPVVSTDLPAIKTYLDESVSILGRKSNTDDLCDAIAYLQKNEARRNEMALNARKRAVKLFNWTEIASATAEIFRRYA